MKQVRIVVRGRVQGVGFRYSATDRARDLGVGGWVRNRADGAVEVVAQGSEDAVDAFVAWCGHGPGSARVDEVSVTAEPVSDGLSEFTTRR